MGAELGLGLADLSAIKSPKQPVKQGYVSPRAVVKSALKPQQAGPSLVSTFLNLAAKKPSFAAKDRLSPRVLAKPAFHPSLGTRPPTSPVKPRPQSPYVRTSSKRLSGPQPQPQTQPGRPTPNPNPGRQQRESLAEPDPLACLDKLIRQTVSGGGYFDEPEEKTLLKTQDEDLSLQENQVLLPPLRRKGTPE